MSVTFKGFGATEIKPQPGFTATLGENGAWTGAHSFAIRRTAWGNSSVRTRFGKGTAITSLDPGVDNYFNFLKVVEATIDSEEGDIMMVSVSISGGTGSQYGGPDELAEEARPTYYLAGSLQDASLDEHPKWRALGDEAKEALGYILTGVLVWDAKTSKVSRIVADAATADEFFDPFLPYEDAITGDAIEFAKLISSGVTTYLRPTITWTESTQGTGQLSAAQLNTLGKISNPRGGAPEPNGARNWMLTSASQSQNGEVYTTDIEWTLSERQGFSDFLYGS